MKKIYPFTILLSFLLFSGCSKDIFEKYDKRIIGTWRITDVDRVGFGGNVNKLPFREGTFTFNEDGTLIYTDAANNNYQGNWDIRKKGIDNYIYNSLQLTAVDYTNQVTLSEHYDDIYFLSTNHFKARIIAGFHTYITHFRR